MSELSFARDFPAATRDDWLKRVDAVLKGEGSDNLVSRTIEGIAIQPLSGQVDGPRVARSSHAPWSVIQRIDHRAAAKANEQALADLEGGATGLVINIQDAPSARGFGLEDAETRTIARALKDVRLDAIAMRLDAGPNGRQAAQSLAESIRGSAVNPALLDLSFGMDPIGVLAQRGSLDEPWAPGAKLVAETVKDLASEFGGPFVEAAGRVWHDAGAGEVLELAATLATGVAYLRALDALGDDILARAIGVTLSADQDMFATLAKFRAMRLLWSRVNEASGLPDTPLKLHAETSWRMMSARDAHMNILRATAAVFGAGLGGADSITVLPFSLAQGLPNSFARRIARNTQSILIAESNLWHVSDPANGAGAIEELTRSLCEKAWGAFQQIEREGGIAASLESGTMQSRIAVTREKLIAEVRDGKQVIIGTTAYKSPADVEASIEDLAAIYPALAGLAPERLSQGFEA
jgi:methylmalonyl-CoA mutase